MCYNQIMKTNHENEKEELIYLCNLFKRLFKDKIDRILYRSIYDKLVLYKNHINNKELLEIFVQDYFRLRNGLANLRDDLSKNLQSLEYKEASLMGKLGLKHKYNRVEQLCKNIHKFEHEFYLRTNISLLFTEMDRYAKHKNHIEV